MKKIFGILTIFSAVLSTTIAFAQDVTAPSTDSRNDFKVGLKAGINLSNVYDEEGDNFVAESKVGFAGGMFFEIPFGKFVGFQPEIMYSQKGFKATGNTLLGSYNYTKTSNYIDLPLLLQLKPFNGFSILAGPQFSYLISTTNDYNGNMSTAQENEINSDNYKRNIFGFTAGLDFNSGNFIISTRAGWDISQSDTNGDSTKPRYKNQVLQLTLGYAF